VGLVAWLGWRSLGWPLIHDAPIMHYIAWLMAQGGAPYRDAFDMNLPGVYLIHWAVMSLGGAGDLAWRLFDLAWLGAVCLLLFVYCRPLGDQWAAGSAAALFALYHLSGGAWRTGQRDFLLCLFLLIGVLGVARAWERGGARGPLLWAGAALGAGLMVKPQSGLFWLGCAGVAAWGAARCGRSPIAAAGLVLGAGLVIPALVFGWLEWRGGLGAFVAILTGYVVPLYGRLGRVASWEAIGWFRFGWQLWTLFAALALLAAVGPVTTGMGARRALALLGIVYGWLHFVLQGKGWEYHLYPAALFLCAGLPFAVMRPFRPGRYALAGATRRALALVLAGALVVALGVKGAEATAPPWIADKARRVAALSRDLQRFAAPGRTIQVMDVTEGGIHALLRLGARQPTRFIYDFHFFHDESDPRIQALRAEFLAGIERARPAAIVVLKETWHRPGYTRLDEWPGLMRLLGERYTLALEGDGYRIYAKRTDP
jgi:4-amino-4-deoxy-L-arabinose transferase-like glycosyltransferase